MKEIDVALTDYGLTILCFIVAFTLIRNHSYNKELSRWFAILFLSVGLASGFGGTVHGLVSEDTLLHSILWRSAIICIGVSALSGWMIGANIMLNTFVQKTIRNLAIVNFTLYSAYVLLLNQNFAHCSKLFAFSNFLIGRICKSVQTNFTQVSTFYIDWINFDVCGCWNPTIRNKYPRKIF